MATHGKSTAAAIRLIFLVSLSVVASTHSLKAKTEYSEQWLEVHQDTATTPDKQQTFNKSTFPAYSLHSDKKECESDADCPLWAYCNNNSYCSCREDFNKDKNIACNNYTLELSVLVCQCVTYDNVTGQLFHGMCMENCNNEKAVKEYVTLPLQVSDINKFLCESRWNRTGRLCGKCLPGHSPLAYSFDMRCVKCPEGNTNIWKFVLAAFGPLTIFYCIILFLKINAISSQLYGYLIFSQTISTSGFARTLVMYEQTNPSIKIPIQILGVLYSMWNLDILKTVYPNICLDVSTLTVLAMEYSIGIYPLVLIAFSYLLIELHDRNFRVIVLLWKPFRCLFILFRRNWDIRTTVLDAYVIFFLLSFTKLVAVSVDLLLPVRAQDLTSGNSTWVLYYDGTIDYFGKEHLPYAILAAVILVVFAIFPTLLLVVYPLKCFQRLLGCLKLRCHALHAVMDSFQGYYKNGTEPGTRDCRWFVAVPLIGRLVCYFIYALTLDSSFLAFAAVTAISLGILTITVQPYKSDKAKYTIIDATFWGFLAMFFCMDTTVIYDSLKPKLHLQITRVITLIIAIIPVIYMSCITIHWILSRMRKLKEFVSRLKAWRRGYYPLQNNCEEFLPDRLTNPDLYRGENLQEPVCDHVTVNYDAQPLLNDTY